MYQMGMAANRASGLGETRVTMTENASWHVSRKVHVHMVEGKKKNRIHSRGFSRLYLWPLAVSCRLEGLGNKIEKSCGSSFMD